MSERLQITPVKLQENHGYIFIQKEAITTFRGNKLIYATAEDGLEVVIKISSKVGGSENEWQALVRAYDMDISVPKPLLLGKTDSGQDAIVSLRIFGNSLSLDMGVGIRDSLGKVIKKMHDSVFVNGAQWAKSGKKDFSYYENTLHRWINSPLSDIKYGSVQAILSELSQPMANYCYKTSPVFNHNDLHDGQVILEGNKIVLVDFENWQENSRLNEIAFYLFHCIRMNRRLDNFNEFLRGYLEGVSISEEEKIILLFNVLFISSRALEYFSLRNVKYLETAKNNHRKVLDFVEKETLWKGNG